MNDTLLRPDLPASVAFGAIDPELPLLLGQVAMLAALLEQDVASIAMSVDNGEQNEYLADLFGANVRVTKKRFPLYDATDFERHAVEVARAFIQGVQDLMNRRNDLLHRVWARPHGDTWGGHKGVRRADIQPGTLPIGWKDFDPAEIRGLVDGMIRMVERAREVVPMVSALARRP